MKLLVLLARLAILVALACAGWGCTRSPHRTDNEPHIGIRMGGDGMPVASSTFAENIDGVYWTWVYIAISLSGR